MKICALGLSSLCFAQIVLTFPYNIGHNINNFGKSHKPLDSAIHDIVNGLKTLASHSPDASKGLNRFIWQNPMPNKIDALTTRWTGDNALTTKTAAQSLTENIGAVNTAANTNTVQSLTSNTGGFPNFGKTNHFESLSSKNNVKDIISWLEKNALKPTAHSLTESIGGLKIDNTNNVENLAGIDNGGHIDHWTGNDAIATTAQTLAGSISDLKNYGNTNKVESVVNINNDVDHWIGNNGIATTAQSLAGSISGLNNFDNRNNLESVVNVNSDVAHWTGNSALASTAEGLAGNIRGVINFDNKDTHEHSANIDNSANTEYWIGNSALTNAAAQSLAGNIQGFKSFSNANNVGTFVGSINHSANAIAENKAHIGLVGVHESREEVHSKDLPEESDFIGYVTFEGYLPVEGTVNVANGVCELCSTADSVSNVK